MCPTPLGCVARHKLCETHDGKGLAFGSLAAMQPGIGRMLWCAWLVCLQHHAAVVVGKSGVSHHQL